MARRHSLDLHFNPRRASEEFLSQYCESLLTAPLDLSRKRVTAAKGSSGRRSFHGGELKRETARNAKSSASVSVVGLGCWTPSQPMKAFRQNSHHPSHEASSLIAGGDNGPSENIDACCLHSAAGSIQISGSSSPIVYVCPVPNSSATDKAPSDVCPYKSTVCRKGSAYHVNEKSIRHQQEHNVRDVQIAIQKLSSKLRRMELDEVLLPAAWQELAAEKYGDDAVSVTHEERPLERASLRLDRRRYAMQGDQRYIIQEEIDTGHGRSFPEKKSGRVHSQHRVRRRKRAHGPPDHLCLQLSPHSEGAKEHDSRVQSGYSFSQIHLPEEGIQVPELEKAEPLHVEPLGRENSNGVGSIELEKLLRLREGVCHTGASSAGEVSDGNHVILALPVSTTQDVSTEPYSNGHRQETPKSDEAKSLCLVDLPASEQVHDVTECLCAAHIPPLQQVPNKLQDPAEPVSQIEAAENCANNRYSSSFGCSGTRSPCFSELLLGSSDVGSCSTEDSSQLSQALQNLSGGQGQQLTRPEECPRSPQAKQNIEQSFLSSLLCNKRSGDFPTSGDRGRALLWIHDQNEASQKNLADIDLTLVLRRFGNLLLHMMPHEGMHVVALEPLFHETIRVAKSFLRVCSSYMFELSKGFFTNEYLDEQRDRNVSLVQMAPLPTTLFVHKHHIGYGVQALLNEPIFDGFDKPSYCSDKQNVDSWVLLVQFQSLCMVAPMDAIDPMNDSYNRDFHSFCSKKLQLVKDKCPWLTEWPDRLLEAFLEAMKYIWQAHLIACALVDAIRLLRFQEWSPYDSSVMEVADYDHNAAAFIRRVQFMLTPGFELQGSVVKSEVYLIPKT